MAEPPPQFTEENFPPLSESATTRDQPPVIADQADSDGEGNEDQDAACPNKGKDRETTPAQSEAAHPPDSVLGDDDTQSQSSAEEEDDENDPHLQADLRTTIRESKEEARRAQSQDPVTFTNPDVGPSKRARTSSIPDLNRAYHDPKTPQKRKGAAQPGFQPVDDRFDASPTPTLQWAQAIAPPSMTNSTAPSPQPQSDLRARVEDAVDEDDLGFFADEDVDMEDANTAGDQSVRGDSPLFFPGAFRFDDDETPTSFNSRGVRGSDRNPNHNLPPRNYTAMPSAYLRALGHVSRNEDRSMPSYVATIEHWQKNISPDMLQMVNEEGGWLALHLFDGGTLQRLANEANDEDVVRAIRSYILGFPGVKVLRIAPLFLLFPWSPDYYP
ncbi:hypothetical protein PQX77_011427 [Marasmius sp. AFHP31]|nr:hypothetical protein PQX77_011427 [Marasmius sp. AFHP31]